MQRLEGLSWPELPVEEDRNAVRMPQRRIDMHQHIEDD